MTDLASGPTVGGLLRDERGVGTIWALLWLILLFGMGGLAVDVTLAYRTETQLQATADAAALAGTIALPVNDKQTETTAVASSVDISYDNMIIQTNGTVLMPDEVYIGAWDHVNKTIVPPPVDPVTGKQAFPSAVLVTTRRDDENENPVGLTFLRIVGVFGSTFNRWNVHAQAAAERFIPECLAQSGMVARGVVDYQSNNTFRGEFCIHSEDYVKVSNNNSYGNAVTVSMPKRCDLTHGSTKMCDPGGAALFKSNLYPDASTLDQRVISRRLDPKMVDHIDELIAVFKNPALDAEDQRTSVIPAYLRTDPATGEAMTPTVVKMSQRDFNAGHGWQFSVASTYSKGQRKIIWVNDCESHRGGDKITIGDNNAKPSNPLIITELAIVTDCIIDFTSNVILSDVVLASAWVNGNLTNDNIKFAGDDVIGRPDGCADGGGVLVLSKQTVSSPAQLVMNGVQIVAAGDITLAAKANGLSGINFQAGGRISVTSNELAGAFGCQEGILPLITVDYYRLVF